MISYSVHLVQLKHPQVTIDTTKLPSWVDGESAVLFEWQGAYALLHVNKAADIYETYQLLTKHADDLNYKSFHQKATIYWDDLIPVPAKLAKAIIGEA